MTNEQETVEVDEKERAPLLPDRHPNGELFVCDIFDAVPKGDMASMEHPIFSLSTKPDLRMRRYEHGDRWVEITPSVKGLATVHDRDILIYCISQLIAGLNQGKPAVQTVRLKAYDLMIATNRNTGGEAYEGLKAALERLKGTQISTNIITGGEEVFETFGLIDKAKVVRQSREGRMQEIEIKLSDWVFNAIQAKEVLTLHKDYYRLRKPLERRMYELARKHCGQQASWTVSLEVLQKKCGSSSSEKEFRRLVRAIVKQDMENSHMPDYAVTMTVEDQVCFTRRRMLQNKPAAGHERDPLISGEGMITAKQAAPGYDVYALYQEWVSWWRGQGCPELKHAEAAFIGFCTSRHKRFPLT